MSKLATPQETIMYGGLGNKFDCDEMISQFKVMYDNIDALKQGIDDKDIIRLFRIQKHIINCIVELNEIIELNDS